MVWRLLKSAAVGVVLGVLASLGVLAWLSSRPPRTWTFPPNDQRPVAKVAALRAGAPQSVAMEALRDDDPDVRLVAVQHLGGPARVQTLIDTLRDNHAGVRRQAAESLSAMGTAAAPALVEALRDQDPRVRAEAAFALGDLHKKDWRDRSAEEERLVVPPLCELLKDPDVEVRRNAARTLAQLRLEVPEARSTAAGACRDALDDEDAAVRSDAARALELHGREKEEGR
jgi:HEAT repeat protein